MTSKAQDDAWSHTWSCSTRLPIEPGSVSTARAFVTFHLMQRELTSPLEDVRLVVSELATNALLHAQTPFSLTLHGSIECIRVEVEDASTSDPAPRPGTVTDERGRGLTIVDVVSARWGAVHSHLGKTVWAEFPLPRTRGRC